MRFSLATIATAALVLSASAAPHRGHGKDRNSTDTEEQGGKGAGRGRYEDGTFPSGAFGSHGIVAPTARPAFSGKPPGSDLTASPTALPSGGPDLSTMSFGLPSAPAKLLSIKRAKSEDSKSEDSSKSKGSKDKSSSGDKETSSGDKETSSGDKKSSSGDKKSSSGDKETSTGDKETSSGDKETSSGDKETSSGSGDKETSSGSGDKETSSGSGDKETSSGSGDKETSSGSGKEPSSGSGSGSGSGDEKPSAGSGSGSGGSSSGGSSGGDSNSTAPTKPSGGGSSASGTFPTAAGESTLSAPMEVTDFDGGLVKFGRGVSCSSGEGGEADAVFIVADGGSLSNVIIGADQIEGVHCVGACTITNVWWEAVCEDALTFKGDGAGTVTGGGAKGAKDKVIQHNGVGTISISGFHVEDFGKLYRSCGNCKTQGERHVKIDGVTASGGSAGLIGINSNFGDTATITNSCITATKVICQEFQGTSPGNEPKSISTGPSSACIYTEADVNAC